MHHSLLRWASIFWHNATWCRHLMPTEGLESNQTKVEFIFCSCRNKTKNKRFIFSYSIFIFLLSLVFSVLDISIRWKCLILFCKRIIFVFFPFCASLFWILRFNSLTKVLVLKIEILFFYSFLVFFFKFECWQFKITAAG